MSIVTLTNLVRCTRCTAVFIGINESPDDTGHRARERGWTTTATAVTCPTCATATLTARRRDANDTRQAQTEARELRVRIRAAAELTATVTAADRTNEVHHDGCHRIHARCLASLVRQALDLPHVPAQPLLYASQEAPMNTAYEDLLRHVLENGKAKGDRTGTGTRSVFGAQMRFDLSEGFPLITTKKVFTKGIVHELLWLIAGETNIQRLLDNDVHIWDAWANDAGDLGPVYGAQWRRWRGPDGREHDQLAGVLDSIRTDPGSRRHIVSAWNVGELDDMALVPCHAFFQFDVTDGRLSCQLTQRSADLFLGVPFNIASYALLTHMVAQQTGLEVGDFIWTGGDCHIYNNHIEQVTEQVGRTPYPFPTLRLNRAASLFDYTFKDVQIENYRHHPAIKGAVSV